MEVLEGGGFALVAALDVAVIDAGGAAVNDGFLLGGEEPVPHELLTQGEKELRLQHHRVLAVPVALLHVHGVDVVGGGGGDVHHLAAQPFDEGPVLGLRIYDNDVILRGQRQIDHLPLGGEGLAGAGHPKDKAVAVQKLLPVGDDEVFADHVLPIVHSALIPHLLGLEGHEDGQGLGGQRPQGVDPPQAQRECSHQPVRLLPVEGGELAQVLPGGGLEGVRVAVQLLLGVCQMHQGHHGEHHPLVAGGEVVQHLPGFFSLLFQIIRHHGGEIVVAVLPALPVGDVRLHTEQPVLHLPDGFVRGDGDHIDGQHHGAVQGRQLGDHAVLDIAGVLLQEQHPAKLISHDEVVLLKLQAVGTDGVLEAVALPHQVPEIQMVLRLLASAVEVVQHPETLHRVQLLAVGIQVAQTGGHIRRHPVEEGAGLLDVFAVNGQGDVPLLHHAVGAVGDLIHQHGVVLGPVAVQVIVLPRQQDLLLEVLAVEALVVDGELGGGAGVQGVQQLRVTQEHGRFVLFRGDGVVDVREADGLGELAPELEDPIRPQAADGDGVLHGLGEDEALPVLLQRILQGFNQSSVPPLLWNAPSPGRTDSPPGTPAFWGTAAPSG